jgi:hypothetical protein
MNKASFDNEVDAAIAYNKAALEYFGEYAVLNATDGEIPHGRGF